MIRKPFLIISIVALMALGRETLTAAETATPEEAKVLLNKAAHDAELRKEEKGKAIEPPVSINSRRNHLRIGSCIQDASLALSEATGLPWALCRDWNYQMSNRFAW
jgi:hypothetical protein